MYLVVLFGEFSPNPFRCEWEESLDLLGPLRAVVCLQFGVLLSGTSALADVGGKRTITPQSLI